jgi:hypothetical protein
MLIVVKLLVIRERASVFQSGVLREKEEEKEIPGLLE